MQNRPFRVHHVIVSKSLSMGSSFWQSCHSLRMESQMHHATTICTTILGDAPRFSKNAPRFRSMHQASFQNAPRKWEMHQAFSEMHQGKRKNATDFSHSIKIVVLSHNSTLILIRSAYCFFVPRAERRPHAARDFMTFRKLNHRKQFPTDLFCRESLFVSCPFRFERI